MFNPFDSGGGGSSSGTSGKDGKDGRGIVSIIFKSSTEGSTPGIAGALDTYEIKYTDNTSSFFQVKNGEDGNVGFSGDFSDLTNIPNTIAGYGIQDANIVDNTITLGANSIDVLTQDDVSSAYSSLSASPVNGIAVSDALQTLDASEVGGANKIIQSISETNGVISATAVDIASTYSSTGTSPVNGAAISDALGTLDVQSAGGNGQYIQSIKQTDGKISATVQTMDIEPTNNSTRAVTSGGVYTRLQKKPTVSSTTITPNPGVAFTNFQYSALVTGDVITINIRAVPTNALAVSTSFLFASVASGYRPPYIIAGSCFANNALRQCWVNIEGGVRLRIDEEIPAGSTIVISFSFVHNDDKWTDVSPVSSLNSVNTNNVNFETTEFNAESEI